MSIANKLGLGARIIAVAAAKAAIATGRGIGTVTRDVRLGLQGKELVPANQRRRARK